MVPVGGSQQNKRHEEPQEDSNKYEICSKRADEVYQAQDSHEQKEES